MSYVVTISALCLYVVMLCFLTSLCHVNHIHHISDYSHCVDSHRVDLKMKLNTKRQTDTVDR